MRVWMIGYMWALAKPMYVTVSIWYVHMRMGVNKVYLYIWTCLLLESMLNSRCAFLTGDYWWVMWHLPGHFYKDEVSWRTSSMCARPRSRVIQAGLAWCTHVNTRPVVQQDGAKWRYMTFPDMMRATSLALTKQLREDIYRKHVYTYCDQLK